MKRQILLLILLCSMLTIIGCGKKEESKYSKNTASGSKKTEKSSDINIDDIKISFEAGSSSDYSYTGESQDIMKLVYENNTKYTIYGLELTLELKDDMTMEKMKTYFPDSVAEDMSEYEYSDFEAVNYGKTNPGESSDYGISYMNKPELPFQTQEAIDDFPQKSLKVIYIGDDDLVHYSEYSYSNKTWSEYEEASEQHVGFDTEFAKLLPEVELDIVQSYDENEFVAYDTSKDYFDEYVSKVKDAGFTVDDISFDEQYSAYNNDKTEVTVNYIREKNIMEIKIENYED